MIRKIILENWKTHRSSELEFNTGTNVLIGKMGSGKTSVMDAICFALFGTFPALQRKEISLEEIIMSKPCEEDYARILLEFEYGKDSFSVERTIQKKKSSQAKLYRNGEFIAGPQVSEVSEMIARLLEIDYDLFSRAIYSEQNQLDYFLKLSPRERKEKFDTLLGLDKYEIVRENAVKVKNKMKTLMEERKSFMEQQKKEFNEKELQELENRILSIGEEIGKLSKELLEKEKDTKEKEKELKLVEEKTKQFELLERQCIQTQAIINAIEKDLKETKVEEEKTVLEKIEKTEKESKEIETVFRELNEKVMKCNEEIAVDKSTVFNEKQLIEHLQKTHANCPICRTELSAEKRKKLLEEKEELIESIGKKRIELEKEAEGLKKESKEKERMERILEEEKIELHQMLKKLKEIEEKKKRFEGNEKILGEIEDKLKKMDFDKESRLKKQREFDQLKEKSFSLKKTIEVKKELMQEVEKRMHGIKDRKKSIAELEKSIQVIAQADEKIALFINSLKETQAQLRHTLIETINQAMQDLWKKIYPYEDYTEVKMSIEEGNYELRVKTKGKKWEKIEGILSGGERSAVALTARIAFSLVLTRNLSWLILDEPTHNLDKTTIEKVSLLMREYLPELVEQIFLITHDTQMENAASATLYVLNREKNEEGITKPVQMNIS